MFTIKTLNAISPVGLTKLNKNLFDVSVDADAPDGILVRSADLLNTTFNDGLLAIARAGAGVNNIPLDRCSEQGIVVFNTPGANANAVAELVIGMLIAGSRNVADAAQWTQGLAGDAAMAKSGYSEEEIKKLKRAKADPIIAPSKGQVLWEVSVEGPSSAPFIGRKYQHDEVFCYLSTPWGEYEKIWTGFTGRVVEVCAKQGDVVNKGDVIAYIQRSDIFA